MLGILPALPLPPWEVARGRGNIPLSYLVARGIDREKPAVIIEIWRNL